MITPTYEQQAICQAAYEGHDLIKISAGAGTGKTSTTELLAMVPARRPGHQLYSQFTVAGGEDAERRMAVHPGVDVIRPGQLAVRSAARWQVERWKASERMRVKNADLARDLLLTHSWVDANTMMRTPAAWLRAMRETVRHFCQSWDDRVHTEHAEAAGVMRRDRELMAQCAQWLWDEHLSRETSDFPYTFDNLKKHWSLRCPPYDYSRIMLDEAQDTNPCDLHVYRNQNAQLIVIGDTQQQLYDWRGSIDSLSDDTLPGGIWLPLTGSFRFGPQIAEVANVLLGKLGADYRLQGLGQPGSVARLDRHPDAVLCRTNAGCMKAAIGHLQAGHAVALAGKTRRELLGLANGAMALKKHRASEHPALAAFGTWGEFRDWAESEPDGQEYITLIRLVETYGERLVEFLKSMTDDDADVTCATVWKAKGLEWGAVELADDFWPGEGGDFNEGLARWWMDGDRRAPFLRVGYVAVTRARQTLDWSNLSWIRNF